VILDGRRCLYFYLPVKWLYHSCDDGTICQLSFFDGEIQSNWNSLATSIILLLSVTDISAIRLPATPNWTTRTNFRNFPGMSAENLNFCGT